jgi:hypothetical protein
LIKGNFECVNIKSGVVVNIPPFFLDTLSCLVKDSKDGKIFVSFEKAKKPRTTGHKSQSAHVHGHLSTIAQWSGHALSEIKDALKNEAMDAGRYPFVWIKERAVPKSEATLTSKEEADFIEFIHQFAAENLITLKEE